MILWKFDNIVALQILFQKIYRVFDGIIYNLRYVKLKFFFYTFNKPIDKRFDREYKATFGKKSHYLRGRKLE